MWVYLILYLNFFIDTLNKKLKFFYIQHILGSILLNSLMVIVLFQNIRAEKFFYFLFFS